MRRIAELFGVAVTLGIATNAFAYNSHGTAALPATSGGTVTESTTFAAVFVAQGAGDTSGTVVPTFGTGGNAFRNSGAAIRVNVTTNLAGNRVIVYTNNLSATAVPQAQINPATGNDGGGLVGATDRTQIVPLLWALSDTNAAAWVFNTTTPVAGAPPGTSPIGDDEIFVTDRAHAATFTTISTVVTDLDARPLVRCIDSSVVTNPAGDGLYPQFFGGPGATPGTQGATQDLCVPPATPGGLVGAVMSQELSKNIAVTAFNCNVAGSCLAPNLATFVPTDTITVTSPYFLPLGANFTNAAPQSYSTNTLTAELVAQ